LLTLIFGAGAFENSVLLWTCEHRTHHKHVDDDEDPYVKPRQIDPTKWMIWTLSKLGLARRHLSAIGIGDKVILHHWVQVRFLTVHLSGNQLVSRCHSSALTLKVDDPNLFIMR
jgi:hypothetical protein